MTCALNVSNFWFIWQFIGNFRIVSCNNLWTWSQKTHIFYTHTHTRARAHTHTTRAHTHTHLRSANTHTHTRAFTRTHTRTRIHTRARTHTRTTTHTQTHTHTHKRYIICTSTIYARWYTNKTQLQYMLPLVIGIMYKLIHIIEALYGSIHRN